MADAFQRNAFQNDAFQTGAGCSVAFQPNAFQNNAFQAVCCESAFQSGAFQSGAFQICGETPVPPVAPAYGGVWMYGLEHWKRLRGEEEKPPSEAIVEAIASVVDRVPDGTAALLLRLELEQQRRNWRQSYVDAIDAYREGLREYQAQQVAQILRQRDRAATEMRRRTRNRAMAILLLTMD